MIKMEVLKMLLVFFVYSSFSCAINKLCYQYYQTINTYLKFEFIDLSQSILDKMYNILSNFRNIHQIKIDYSVIGVFK